MKTIITTLSLLTSIASADILIDEDFEDYAGGTPSGWNKQGDSTLSVGAGLDGSTTSIQLGASGNSSSTALVENFTAVTQFSFQFDFQQLATGTDRNGDRLMNFTLRNNDNSVVNWRVLWDGSVDQGTMQFYNGSAWQAMSTQNELINQTDTYRVALVGDNTSYSISVSNLSDSTIVGSESGISDFQVSSLLNELRFERGRSEADYIVDNVLLTNVPEPQAFAAILGFVSFAVIGLRRRR